MISKEAHSLFLNGDEAVAHGVRLCRPHVISAYPITPQTITVERLADFVADGDLDTEYLYVESEHSAMAAALGAAYTGARPFTATSSQGLLYMCEMLHYVSGARLPIVMMNACRSTAAPWNIFGDQRDSLSQRDSGWIQIYCENGQEALDTIIQAYRLAEHPEVYTPVMVCIDGFVNTHTYELVEIPAQEQVDAFLPPLDSRHKVDFANPHGFSVSVNPNYHTEFRIQQQQAILKAAELAAPIDAAYKEKVGRSWGGMVEEYRMDDAESCIVAMGSAVGTIRETVDELRAAGRKVGLVKVRYFRPFPKDYFAALSGKVKAIGVLNKEISFGYEGSLTTEVKAALCGRGPVAVCGYHAGLGGRDISRDTIRAVYASLDRLLAGEDVNDPNYIDARW